MKKQLVIGIVVLTLVMTALAIVPTPTAHTESAPYVRTLWAGQDIPVGTVSVWNDENSIHVIYEITADDWELTGTHLYVGKTNPNSLSTAPGQFPYSVPYSSTAARHEYVIPLNVIDGYHLKVVKGKTTGLWVANGAHLGVTSAGSVFIAAHAGVRYETYSESCDDIISGLTTTKWTDTDGVTTYDAVPCYVHPSWATVTGATWIWRTALTDSAYEYANVPRYDIVTPKDGWLFANQFTLPSTAYDITGDIDINSDNSYEFSLNNVFIGGEGSMNKDGPDTQGWSTVVNYPIAPVPGLNELQFRALNYYNYGDSYGNPAGLAFNAEICYKYDYQCRAESAWADGTDFTHPNWAMYFLYDIQGWELKDTVTVPATATTPVTSITFANGEHYKLVASGTANAGDGIQFDAKYSYRTPTSTEWTDAVSTYESYGANLLDLYVNGNNVDWGAYNPAHTYTIYLDGTGTPANFGFQTYDVYYPNNVGSLTVQVYQWV